MSALVAGGDAGAGARLGCRGGEGSDDGLEGRHLRHGVIGGGGRRGLSGGREGAVFEGNGPRDLGEEGNVQVASGDRKSHVKVVKKWNR